MANCCIGLAAVRSWAEPPGHVVFLRIRPGVNESHHPASHERKKAGESLTKLTKFGKADLFETIRTWRKQTMPESRTERITSGPIPVMVIRK